MRIMPFMKRKNGVQFAGVGLDTGGGGGGSLPIASDQTLGGVKTGYNMSCDSDGVLTANIWDFDTVEKRIGTYNGKPLYRKKFTGLNYPMLENNWNADVVTIPGGFDDFIFALISNDAGTYYTPVFWGKRNSDGFSFYNLMQTGFTIKSVCLIYTKK